MRTIEDLERARADGSVLQKLKEMVIREKRDIYVRRQLSLLSPHLTAEEVAYCGTVDHRKEEWV